MVVEHRGDRNNGEVEDYVHFNATIGASDWAVIPSEGASVSCTWDFSGLDDDNEETDLLEIVGPKGSLRMAAMSASLPVTVCNTNGEMVQELTFETPQHTAQAMIQAVTDDILLRGSPQEGTSAAAAAAPFLSRADNAIRTSQVIDEVLAGYYGNREPGYWTDPASWPGRRRE